MFVLVTYDIGDAKRLRKVAKVMKDYGHRVQRSVFECLIDERKLSAMVAEIDQCIDEKMDTVRIYRLCNSCRETLVIRGQGTVSEDPDVYIY